MCIYIHIINIHSTHTHTHILCKQKLLFWMQLIAINRLTALDFKDKKEMPQKSITIRSLFCKPTLKYWCTSFSLMTDSACNFPMRYCRYFSNPSEFLRKCMAMSSSVSQSRRPGSKVLENSQYPVVKFHTSRLAHEWKRFLYSLKMKTVDEDL